MSETHFLELLAKFGGTQMPPVTVPTFADAVRMEAESIRAKAVTVIPVLGRSSL